MKFSNLARVWSLGCEADQSGNGFRKRPKGPEVWSCFRSSRVLQSRQDKNFLADACKINYPLIATKMDISLMKLLLHIELLARHKTSHWTPKLSWGARREKAQRCNLTHVRNCSQSADCEVPVTNYLIMIFGNKEGHHNSTLRANPSWYHRKRAFIYRRRHTRAWRQREVLITFDLTVPRIPICVTLCLSYPVMHRPSACSCSAVPERFRRTRHETSPRRMTQLALHLRGHSMSCCPILLWWRGPVLFSFSLWSVI